MSPPSLPLKVGLGFLGLCGLVGPARAADPDDPAPPAPAALVAPESAATLTVLLLSNGRVLTGKVTRDGSLYLLQQKGGTLKYPAAQVERAFGSIGEVYQYKFERLPARDPDEQLKMARWCLTVHLDAEAKTHLEAILALSPRHREARAMMDSLLNAAARAAARDPAVIQAGYSDARDRKPAELDPEMKRILGNPGLPRIFDLPPAQAVKRADEFTKTVHPVLQKYCANCHDENYPGSFQLVMVKGRADRSSTGFRANLDATLRLVDPVDPRLSVLLSSTLRPHGTRKRPIFTGANDPGYLVLWNWVNEIRSPQSAAASGRLTAVPSAALPTLARQPEEGEGFATARGDAPTVGAAAVPQARPTYSRPPMVPGMRYVPGVGMVREETPPLPGEFPLPFVVGGENPLAGAVKPAEPPAAGPAPPAATTSPVGPPSAAAAPTDPEAAPPKKPAKPVKLNDALLEQLLKNRNMGR